jgi:hypothetical protein
LPGDEQARPLAVRLLSFMDEIVTSQVDLTKKEKRWTLHAWNSSGADAEKKASLAWGST